MKSSKLLCILSALATALLVLSASVAAPILCRPFYYAHIAPLELTRYGLPAEEIRRAAPVIGVARDEAFQFIYADNLRLLEELGAKIVFFSPLHDSHLQEGLQGVLLYGGYPELYAEKLSANDPCGRN